MTRSDLIKLLDEKYGCRCGFHYLHFKDIVKIEEVVDFVIDAIKKPKEKSDEKIQDL